MKKQWFTPKKYGWGFFPVTIKGWIATLVLIGLIFASAYTNNFFDSGDNPVIHTKEGVRFLLDLIVLCCLFTILFKDRLEGQLTWRWGKQNPDRKDHE